MTLLLLLVIYIAYIGLGIPDSLFGTAWPAIYMEFEVPISYSAFVFTERLRWETFIPAKQRAR